MGELLILVIVVLALTGCGRACVWGWRRVTGEEDGRRSIEGAAAGRDLPGGAREGGGDASSVRSAAGGAPGAGGDSRLEELKRRYVEGEITLEEYERALDELDFRQEL